MFLVSIHIRLYTLYFRWVDEWMSWCICCNRKCLCVIRRMCSNVIQQTAYVPCVRHIKLYYFCISFSYHIFCISSSYRHNLEAYRQSFIHAIASICWFCEILECDKYSYMYLFLSKSKARSDFFFFACGFGDIGFWCRLIIIIQSHFVLCNPFRVLSTFIGFWNGIRFCVHCTLCK